MAELIFKHGCECQCGVAWEGGVLGEQHGTVRRNTVGRAEARTRRGSGPRTPIRFSEAFMLGSMLDLRECELGILASTGSYGAHTNPQTSVCQRAAGQKERMLPRTDLQDQQDLWLLINSQMKLTTAAFSCRSLWNFKTLLRCLRIQKRPLAHVANGILQSSLSDYILLFMVLTLSRSFIQYAAIQHLNVVFAVYC